jgi:hypothetical protein
MNFLDFYEEHGIIERGGGVSSATSNWLRRVEMAVKLRPPVALYQLITDRPRINVPVRVIRDWVKVLQRTLRRNHGIAREQPEIGLVFV